jgi:hypothetical protein
MAESPSRRNTSLAIAIIFFNHFLEIQYKRKYSCTYYFSIILVTGIKIETNDMHVVKEG